MKYLFLLIFTCVGLRAEVLVYLIRSPLASNSSSFALQVGVGGRASRHYVNLGSNQWMSAPITVEAGTLNFVGSVRDSANNTIIDFDLEERDFLDGRAYYIHCAEPSVTGDSTAGVNMSMSQAPVRVADAERFIEVFMAGFTLMACFELGGLMLRLFKHVSGGGFSP